VDTRRDLLVGLFVLTALGIIVGTLIVTSGLGNVRYTIYMRTESAQDLTRDTRVLLQGLEIGRVAQLNPVRTGIGGVLNFVGKLSINEKFPDGTPVALPAGSRAVIAQTSSNPISAPVVQIMPPREIRKTGAYLQPGDTIESERSASTMDQLGNVAEHLSVEVEAALKETRRLLVGTNRAVERTDSMLATATPLIRNVLTDLAGTLERTDRMLATLEPRLPALSDSITATLSETRVLLGHLNEVASNANTLATENRTTIRETLDHLHRSSVLMDHFIDQVSRRPVRMLTGVKTPKNDGDGVQP
jgi:ABC-type transporter Mla subunit MlaD